MLHAAIGTVGATLRRHPQLDALVVGFGGQGEAAIANLFFNVGQGQVRLAFALEHHALAAGLHFPGRAIAVGVYGQLLEIGVLAAAAVALQAVELLHQHFTLCARCFAGHKVAAQIGEQFARFIGHVRRVLHQGGVGAVTHHITLLADTRLEHQLVIGRYQLALQAGLAGGGVDGFAAEHLATGKHGQQGEQN